VGRAGLAVLLAALAAPAAPGVIPLDDRVSPGRRTPVVAAAYRQGYQVTSLGSGVIVSPGAGERNAGIGFAIPIDRARRIAEDLIRHGEVRESYTGLEVEDLPAREEGERRRGGGVAVSGVDPGSPAAAAGFRKGDRVESIGGQPVESAEEYRFRQRELPAGTTARVGIRRGRERTTLALRAAELPVEKVEELVLRRTGIQVTEARLGRDRVVAVQSVQRGSAAARYGLEAGDLLLEVNGREVGGLADFRRAASRARRSGQLVLLVRRGPAQERVPFDFD